MATAAVNLGYRKFPSTELPDRGGLPTLPQVAAGKQLAGLLREAFARAGDPEVLTVSDIVDHLSAADPDAWARWDHRPDRLTMAGRTMSSIFRAAQLDLLPVRVSALPGRPTCYQLDQVVRATY